jgi:hypothetical protein
MFTSNTFDEQDVTLVDGLELVVRKVGWRGHLEVLLDGHHLATTRGLRVAHVSAASPGGTLDLTLYPAIGNGWILRRRGTLIAASQPEFINAALAALFAMMALLTLFGIRAETRLLAAIGSALVVYAVVRWWWVRVATAQIGVEPAHDQRL